MSFSSLAFLRSRPSDRLLLTATFVSLILVLPVAIVAGFSVLLLTTPFDSLSLFAPLPVRIILFAYFVTCPLALICAGSLPWLFRMKGKFALGWGSLIGLSLYSLPVLMVIIAVVIRLFL